MTHNSTSIYPNLPLGRGFVTGWFLQETSLVVDESQWWPGVVGTKSKLWHSLWMKFSIMDHGWKNATVSQWLLSTDSHY